MIGVCPECAGQGKTWDEATKQLWGCFACGGSGDLLNTWLLRAYRLGLSNGLDAMSRAMPQYDQPMTLERLLEAVGRTHE